MATEYSRGRMTEVQNFKISIRKLERELAEFKTKAGVEPIAQDAISAAQDALDMAIEQLDRIRAELL